MTYICNRVLKELRTITSNTDSLLCLVDGDPHICLFDNLSNFYDYSKYKNEIGSIIKELVKEGYLEYAFNEYHFFLTHKGLHPHIYKWEDIKHFLLTSIIVPIAVSAVTTVITLHITKWLQ